MPPLFGCAYSTPLFFFAWTIRSSCAWPPSPPSFAINFWTITTSCVAITIPTFTCRCASSRHIHSPFASATTRNVPFACVTPKPCAAITASAIIFCGRSMPASRGASTAWPSLLGRATPSVSATLPPSSLFLTISVSFPSKICSPLWTCCLPNPRLLFPLRNATIWGKPKKEIVHAWWNRPKFDKE